eukprot:scaffold350939_cov35-Attheya_sp.AAC.1
MDVGISMRDYNDAHRSSETNTEGVALFGEGANFILQNDTLSSRTGISTGTPSSATQSTNRNAEGTNGDVGISTRDYNDAHRSSGRTGDGKSL